MLSVLWLKPVTQTHRAFLSPHTHLHTHTHTLLHRWPPQLPLLLPLRRSCVALPQTTHTIVTVLQMADKITARNRIECLVNICYMRSTTYRKFKRNLIASASNALNVSNIRFLCQLYAIICIIFLFARFCRHNFQDSHLWHLKVKSFVKRVFNQSTKSSLCTGEMRTLLD